MKKIISLFLTFALLIGCTSTIVLAATFDIEKAIQYAENHWNDGQGLCAEFVSKCVQAGGINISTQAGTGGCWKAICKKTGLDMYDLTLSSDGNALYTANSSILQRGDVVVQWCYTHSISPHIMICGGYNSNGYATFYAHNGALNNKTYNLKRNTSYQHTTQCNMGAKVIHLSSLATQHTAPKDCKKFETYKNGTSTVLGACKECHSKYDYSKIYTGDVAGLWIAKKNQNINFYRHKSGGFLLVNFAIFQIFY